jgi:hypothetical protein
MDDVGHKDVSSRPRKVIVMTNHRRGNMDICKRTRNGGLWLAALVSLNAGCGGAMRSR